MGVERIKIEKISESSRCVSFFTFQTRKNKRTKLIHLNKIEAT